MAAPSADAPAPRRGLACDVSIIVPVLNEAANLEQTLAPLQPLRASATAVSVEIIVCDGGSTDGTSALAAPLADRVLSSPPGRARQMNDGAAHSRGELLLFLHADTHIAPSDVHRVAIAGSARPAFWGRFDVRLDAPGWLFRVIETLINVRSRITGIATGDQAMFVARSLFVEAGGFADIALMEDVEFSRRMRRIARPVCMRQPVVTSARRWLEHGPLRTILTMWLLRGAYALGADPGWLRRHYRNHAMRGGRGCDDAPRDDAGRTRR